MDTKRKAVSIFVMRYRANPAKIVCFGFFFFGGVTDLLFSEKITHDNLVMDYIMLIISSVFIIWEISAIFYKRITFNLKSDHLLTITASFFGMEEVEEYSITRIVGIWKHVIKLNGILSYDSDIIIRYLNGINVETRKTLHGEFTSDVPDFTNYKLFSKFFLFYPGEISDDMLKMFYAYLLHHNPKIELGYKGL